MRIAIALLLFAAPSIAQEMQVQKDISYAESKNERQKLDVYAPKDGKDLPIILWIHGGGWQSGDKSEVDVKPKAFVDKGYLFISTNYRLLPDATIKEMAGDVAKAIHWTHQHAQDYGGDPESIVVIGHSAGAQLAALVAIDNSYLKAEGLTQSIIKGCVPFDGDTYDVPLQIATVEQRRSDIYKKKFGDAENQKDLSSITHVTKGRYIPPVLILHVAEHPETKMQSERLVSVLKEAGISAKTFPGEETDHVKINANLGLPDDGPTKAMFEFLDSVLKKK